MLATGRQAKAELLDAVVAAFRMRISGDEAASSDNFARQFYGTASTESFLESDAGDLAGAALAAWRFLARRRPGTDKLRVYNPDPAGDGWSSPHTVVTIATDDRPFLVASVTAALTRRDRSVHRVFHPILKVRRNRAGSLQMLYDPGTAPATTLTESLMQFEITHQADAADREAIAAEIGDVLADVRVAVDDWAAMRAVIDRQIEELSRTAPADSADELAEVVALLRWLNDDHFTFLGYREAELVDTRAGPELRTLPDRGLGLLRDPGRHILVDREGGAGALPRKLIDQLYRPGLMFITKADKRSTVHRTVHMDLIRVKRFDASGRVVGGWGFAGLLTAEAYSRPVRDIPVLRRKAQKVFERAGFTPDSHDGKAFLNVLETYPRDELFQITEDELFDNALAMMHLQARPRVRLLLRRDIYERFVSCLVFLPRERYDSALRDKVGEILETALDGQVSLTYTTIGDSPLAQLQFIVKTTPGRIPGYDPAAIEARLAAAARRWSDDFRDALHARNDEPAALRLWRSYGEAFPAGYRERYDAATAVGDVETFEGLPREDGLAVRLYRLPEDGRFGFKIYSRGEIVLSDLLPVLENMGFRVVRDHPFRLTPEDGAVCWMSDLAIDAGGSEDLYALRGKLHDVFMAVWGGGTENDGFNRLVANAGLAWRDVVVLRAYARYLHQVRIPFSQSYIERALVSNPHIAARLVALFHASLDPERADAATAEKIAAAIATDLDAVANLDEDRILRRLLNLVEATLRTNHFQRDREGAPKRYLSFKIDSGRVFGLPLPRPEVEIFVYSPRMEGIHLRGGKVARGGIRWSDRAEDFRTEILGLLKAQMVKNAIIVPVGAKGGFIVRHPPPAADREAVAAEVTACYSTLIRGMLDLTDNNVGGAIVPPPDLVRRDQDDPYLVVAADKGTATFSDLANRIAADYGFWLGDAFASGGSAGYDHKQLGITARGAWEAVKRHFRELGTDIQSERFTVVGIGDMSGDVFGNGMLLSHQIRLIGAFNHLQIFLDPHPDAAASFAERRRLFELPRSSWADYDRSLISHGGGVFDRRAKTVRLSREAKALLAVDDDVLTPNEVIAALLQAPVDLLWNGGIGTYVKASDESHANVGDKANDAVRVDARDLRCRVVGEGGNLGVTQRGRIEAAMNGVRLNTDAIDNSGGVDCSDHEVNIKILLDEVVRDGAMTVRDRNALLAAMTDEVVDLVLRDNYLQTQAISAVEAEAAVRLDRHARLVHELERGGHLNRAVEHLPDDEAVALRRAAGQGLARPELAVLLAYAKMALYPQLLASDLPDDGYLEGDLAAYFPTALRERFPDRIRDHPLRREIVATAVSNSLFNRLSLSFAMAAREDAAATVGQIARSYLVARDAYRVRALWAGVEALDNKVAAAVQVDMTMATRELLEAASMWFLRNLPDPADCRRVIGEFAPGIAELWDRLDEALTEAGRARWRARHAALVEKGVPAALAGRVAGLEPMAAACDIVQVASTCGLPVVQVATVYFDLAARVHLDWLLDAAQRVPTETRWQRQAVRAIVDELFAQHRALTLHVIGNGGGSDDAVVEQWAARIGDALERNEHLFADLGAAAAPDLAMLAVANRHLRGLMPG